MRTPRLDGKLREKVMTLLRSAIAGGAATFADLAVLVALVQVAHLPARAANVPALIVGGVVNFYGNRGFAFRATRGSLSRHVVLYSIVEVVALVLNGVLFDVAIRAIPNAAHAYWLVRLVTSNAVFLLWSYPLWRRVFSAPQSEAVREG